MSLRVLQGLKREDLKVLALRESECALLARWSLMPEMLHFLPNVLSLCLLRVSKTVGVQLDKCTILSETYLAMLAERAYLKCFGATLLFTKQLCM